MNPTHVQIKILTLAVVMAIASLPAWSAEDKAPKKKTAKSAVTSLQAGTLNRDISMDPNLIISPLSQVDEGTQGTSKPRGANTGISTDIGTDGSAKPVGAQSPP